MNDTIARAQRELVKSSWESRTRLRALGQLGLFGVTEGADKAQGVGLTARLHLRSVAPLLPFRSAPNFFPFTHDDY